MIKLPEVRMIRVCRFCGVEVEAEQETCPVDEGTAFLDRRLCSGCGQFPPGRSRLCPTCLARLPALDRLRVRAVDWCQGDLLPALRRAGHESRAVAQETTAETARLTTYAGLTARCLKLSRELERHKLVLGRRMADEGLGDPKYLDRVQLLDDALANLKGSWNPTWSLTMERKGLLLAVAADALAAGTAPDGLEVEFDRALEARDELEAQRKQAAALAETIPNRTEFLARPRLIAGAAALAVPVLLVGWWVLRHWLAK